MEWGTKAYEIMWRLKELFDPEYVLNPGVVLNKVSTTVIAAFDLSLQPPFTHKVVLVYISPYPHMFVIN